jgi:HlyD family secretion protein
MRKFFIILALLLVIGSSVAYYLFYRQERQSNEIILFGNVDVRQVDLGFRVSGRVREMYFEEGDLVPEGKLMGVLDVQPYEDQVMQAQASVVSTRASLSNAEILLSRRMELVGDGSVSQEELDNAVSSKEVFEANLKSGEAALAVALTNLDFTRVYAPTEGIILTRIREPGAVVNPGDPIYTLSIISPVWIRAFIPEPLLGVVYPGMPAEVYTDTRDGTVYKAHVGFISPVAEFTPKTVETTQLRTDLVYRLRIYADNPDQGLRQGMPVTVRLLTSLPPSEQEIK